MIYEPATTSALINLKKNLRLADINERINADKKAKDGEKEEKEDTSFMIIFGGKNAEIDVLFNDIYFLGIP